MLEREVIKMPFTAFSGRFAKCDSRRSCESFHSEGTIASDALARVAAARLQRALGTSHTVLGGGGREFETTARKTELFEKKLHALLLDIERLGRYGSERRLTVVMLGILFPETGRPTGSNYVRVEI